MYTAVIFAGFAGGVLRGLVGFVKHQFAYKQAPFKFSYFLSMMIVSGIIGLIAALAIKEAGIKFAGANSLPWALALIIGYAGGDFLENIYKIIIKKSSLYQEP